MADLLEGDVDAAVQNGAGDRNQYPQFFLRDHDAKPIGHISDEADHLRGFAFKQSAVEKHACGARHELTRLANGCHHGGLHGQITLVAAFGVRRHRSDEVRKVLRSPG
jgi:hypothetical protein